MREEICGIFIDWLGALEEVFRAVFCDEATAGEIARSFERTREMDRLLRERQARTTIRRP
jgi:hypothetical protein